MDGVTGIRPSLETCYYLVGFCQNIHNFTFSLVAPLQAKNHI